MKKQYVIGLFLIVIGIPLYGDTIPYNAETGEIVYEEVVAVDSLVKKELYSNAKEWVALNYKSANAVIQLSDQENGKMIVKGFIANKLFFKEGHYNHILQIDIKDYKYRYKLTVFNYFSSGSGEMAFNSKSLGFKKTIFKDVNNKAMVIIEGLKKAMINKKNKDW